MTRALTSKESDLIERMKKGPEEEERGYKLLAERRGEELGFSTA